MQSEKFKIQNVNHLRYNFFCILQFAMGYQEIRLLPFFVVHVTAVR